MKDWRQEICDIIQARCTHMGDKLTVTPKGCPWCFQTYKKVLAAVDEGLDELIEDADKYHAGLIETFKRSMPSE